MMEAKDAVKIQEGAIQMLHGNHAVSMGVKLARAEVIPAYPITPQTQIVEKISEWTTSGEIDASYIMVESEHSAMAACIGASAAGARAFTATSSHGLLYMGEMVHWAAGSRLPIVMANVNRAVGPPWNIWVDEADSMSMRDTGWIQIYTKNNQEALDATIQAFKIAEHRDVTLPVMVNLAGFVLSHTSMPVDVPSQADVDDFLPPYVPQHYKIDPENPMTLGNMGYPEEYAVFRENMHQSMMLAKQVIKDVAMEYKERFGRHFGDLLELYQTDNAEFLIVTYATIAEEAEVTVDMLRDEGHAVGLVRMRVIRPWPTEELLKVSTKVKSMSVFDRNLSFGLGGVLHTELSGSIYGKARAKIFGHRIGLGGVDVTAEKIAEIVREDIAKIDAGE